MIAIITDVADAMKAAIEIAISTATATAIAIAIPNTIA